MRAELAQIDLSALDELARIRQEESVLEGRLAKMETRNSNVSPAVYAKVRADYETRRQELARGSAPLREKALREYERLKALRRDVERAVDQVSLEKEELEFRRDLGEFPGGEFDAHVAECEKRLSVERRDLEEILRVRERFAAAFRSEEELESGRPENAPAPAAAPPPSAARPAPQPVVAVPAVAEVPAVATAVTAPAAAPAPPPPPSPLAPPPPYTPPAGNPPRAWDGLTPDGTAITAARPVPPVRSSPAAPAARVEEEPVPHSATMVLPRARLTHMEGDVAVREFVLKVGLSVIGRLVQSDIQLASPDVSRKHAQIVVGPDGCFVSDLGSENGVAVNGHLVESHQLEDGDVLVLGKQRLVFHA